MIEYLKDKLSHRYESVIRKAEEEIIDYEPTISLTVYPPEGDLNIDYSELIREVDEIGIETSKEERPYIETNYISHNHIGPEELEKNFLREPEPERLLIDIYADWETAEEVEDTLKETSHRVPVVRANPDIGRINYPELF